MNGLALITGASSGIGFEIAKLAASEGHDLILAADTPLDEITQICAARGVEVTPVQADLSRLDAVDEVLAAAGGRAIDVLVANAGHGYGGPFLEQEVDRWRHVIDTNVTGTLYLVGSVLRRMVARDFGKVLVTGSIAGYIPGSFHAVYNGSKAFIDSFTEALRNEIGDHKGVTLTTLIPGATDTEFFARAGMEDTRVGTSAKADAGKVALDGWTAMKAGQGHVISGAMNKAQVAASGVLPASVLAEAHRKQAQPGSGAAH